MALGVNLFAQEPGIVLGQGREVGRALRTSPLVSIADSLLGLRIHLSGYGEGSRGARP
jgi:hypothetical protein